MRGSERASPASRPNWTLLALLSTLALSTSFLNVALLASEGPIARRIGVDELGYHPGTGVSAVFPFLGAAFVVVAAFGAVVLVRRRGHRVLVAGIAAFGLAAALLMIAFITEGWGLAAAVALGGAALGARAAVSTPILVDGSPPGVRWRMIAWYVVALEVGGALAAGVIGVSVDVLDGTWRDAFLVLGIIAGVLACASFALREPSAGRVAEAERPPDVRLGEQFRQVMRVRASGPMLLVFFTVGVFAVPLQGLLDTVYVTRWDLGPGARSWIVGGLMLAGVPALLLGMGRGDSWLHGNPPRLLLAGAVTAVVAAAGLGVVAVSDPIVPAVVGLVVVFACVSVLLAIAIAVLLSTVTPRLRVHAGALAAFAAAGGVIAGNWVLGELVNQYGESTTVALLAILYLGVAAALRAAARTVETDIDRMLEHELERAEVRRLVASGRRVPLLSCRNLEFSYGQLQVLFGVDFTVDDGEIVALLGTNGAGKSTLLRAISGIAPVSRGTLHYRGEDITYVGAERRCELGITEISGGRAVFGPLSVADNLRVFAFSTRRDRAAVRRGIDATFAAFPALAERRNQPAATLSGGEQQMLALGKAFILQPRLLLIDELSLGLAPIVVSQLLDMVRRINDEGTSVVLVEQSLNIALSLVDHAYFMEKGAMQFDGQADELVNRPDLVRSVFLEGAARGFASRDDGPGSERELR